MPHKTKWMGAAAWSAKEARAGDRLPYLRLIDESTLLLRGIRDSLKNKP